MNDEREHSTVGETLARIDERTTNIARDLENLRHDFHDFKRDIERDYIPKADFKALSDKVSLHQRILFGTIGAVCLTVLGALLMLVVRNG